MGFMSFLGYGWFKIEKRRQESGLLFYSIVNVPHQDIVSRIASKKGENTESGKRMRIKKKAPVDFVPLVLGYELEMKELKLKEAIR